ncbi:MAG: cytochrome c biogenesis protein ResB [Verrucomicrobiota bacterium]|jgi:cytochrome c biogenesis protein ResB|nr:cytochrome c biogenesis protein ResB [Verrucomicrobiota bacterium]
MTKHFWNHCLGLGTAVHLCWVLAVGAVALAFFGAERAGAFMARPAMLGLMTLLAAAFLYAGTRSAVRRRFDSALLHLGCACIVAGWLAGRYAERTATFERPATGAMALVDGEASDMLWSGPRLDVHAGRVPFSVRLERFFVDRYERNGDDRDAGRDAPVREYRSRVTVTEPGKAPYVANVRVNHPLAVRGYHIYQMSWGQTADRMGRPQMYTVLQFIRDPGLSWVYAGFAVLFAGVLLFAVRVFRVKEVPA